MDRFEGISDIQDRTTLNARGCQIWNEGVNRDGYAKARFGGRTWLVHRLIYTLAFGAIPDGMTVDHGCFNRACVNLTHLSLVSRAANARRQKLSRITHCKNGHEYTPANTLARRGTGRACRACANDRARAYRARKVA